jgi:Ribonuclease G/E
MSLETAHQYTGVRSLAGIMLFYDPPNGEIIEQFRQIERETERSMVAVREIRFPEDAAPTAALATRRATARMKFRAVIPRAS